MHAAYRDDRGSTDHGSPKFTWPRALRPRSLRHYEQLRDEVVSDQEFDDPRHQAAWDAMPLWVRVALCAQCGWRDAVWEAWPRLGRALDRRRHGDNRDEWCTEVHDELPDLPDWDAAHTDPESGVWCIHPPCGYPTWQLYGPGTQLNAEGFVVGPPAAKFDALNGPGRERSYDPCRRLADITSWAVPWIEQTSGGHVVEIVEGWSSYGPDLQLREWAVYARVQRP